MIKYEIIKQVEAVFNELIPTHANASRVIEACIDDVLIQLDTYGYIGYDDIVREVEDALTHISHI